MQRDSIANTFLVAFTLCVVCSVLVSFSAVYLRPLQEANKLREMQKNVLIAAGLFDRKTNSDVDVEPMFEKQVERVLVDIKTGLVVKENETKAETQQPVEDKAAKDGKKDKPTDGKAINQDAYDPRTASKDPKLSIAIPAAKDFGGIKRRENYAFVYLIKKEGKLDQIVLPIRGVGLWSTCYGFISLGSDTNAIRGITYYEHGETPGLGGEVENPNWQAKWPGKQAFDSNWNVSIEVTKSAKGPHQVDAISGATITSRGVSNMIKYWLGDDAFGPYLKTVRESGDVGG